jgi:hypothetical protein
MHAHLLSEHIQQVKCQSDVFCVAVEVDNNFIATGVTRKVQARYVFQQRVVIFLLEHIVFCFFMFAWNSLYPRLKFRHVK